MIKGHRTGRAAVVITEGGERSLCCDGGAGRQYPLDHMRTNLNMLENTKVIYSTGHFLMNSYLSLNRVAWFSLDYEKTFAFNISATHVVEKNFT